MQLGWPLPKRKDFIEKLSRTTGRPVHTVFFQQRRIDLPTHPISVEFPKYRLDNGRTRSAQAAYLAQHPEMPLDLFDRDAESETAQKAQHEILKAMLGGGEKDLLRFFSQREQMQPFILTDLGYVLNGNRRLCAFRELITQNKLEYEPRFGTIDVVFLPPADDRDLDRLEALYQLTEDIKEPYSWTARAYMLRVRKKEHKFSNAELSAIYQIPETDVDELLAMLSLAEEFLEQENEPNRYARVDDDEFAFRQLLKARGKLTDETSKEALQQLAFCVIEKWDEGRLYAVIPRIAENLDEVRNAIKSDFSSTPRTKTNEAAALLGLSSIPVDPVSTVLADKGNRKKVREILADVLEAAAERKREAKRENRVITRLTRAHELLSSALADIESAGDRISLLRKVGEIAATVDQLGKKLDADSEN
jgi:hypothetical protein